MEKYFSLSNRLEPRVKTKWMSFMEILFGYDENKPNDIDINQLRYQKKMYIQKEKEL